MGVPLTTEEFISRHKADLQACGFDTQFVAFVNVSTQLLPRHFA